MLFQNRYPRLTAIALLLLSTTCKNSPKPAQAEKTLANDEHWRPSIHFTPAAHWMNDPNGMFFFNNQYHLFYQYNPNASVWGPMHWGHAVSTDLLHWQHRPIALFPDSLGTIFSGSAVVDSQNTSGFGRDGQIPIVAIYTQHDSAGEKAGRKDFQNQSIAFSVDAGETWHPFEGNPVLQNPGIRDFRDPKIIWHAPSRQWIMTLAAGNEVIFYRSPNLREWTLLSRFGSGLGAHGGVWECPDLFPMKADGQEKWVLIVNLNPGAPNGGSGAQYFVGNFDGREYVVDDTVTRWLDYGPDNYAAVTWNNTGNRRLMIGWMSNWQYANVVPTETWRSAMTLPRELHLERAEKGWQLASRFLVPSIGDSIRRFEQTGPGVKSYDLSRLGLRDAFRIKMKARYRNQWQLRLFNEAGEELLLGFQGNEQYYYLQRDRSGQTAFHPQFGNIAKAAQLYTGEDMDIDIVVDRSSIECLAGKGLTALTGLFFPNQPYSRLEIQWADKLVPLSIEMQKLP